MGARVVLQDEAMTPSSKTRTEEEEEGEGTQYEVHTAVSEETEPNVLHMFSTPRFTHYPHNEDTYDGIGGESRVIKKNAEGVLRGKILKAPFGRTRAEKDEVSTIVSEETEPNVLYTFSAHHLTHHPDKEDASTHDGISGRSRVIIKNAEGVLPGKVLRIPFSKARAEKEEVCTIYSEETEPNVLCTISTPHLLPPPCGRMGGECESIVENAEGPASKTRTEKYEACTSV